MSKELEEFERGILEFEKDLEDDCNNEWLKRVVAGMKKCYLRLEQIENANLSEALKKLKENAEMFDEIAQENNHSYKDDTVIEAYVYHFNNVDIEQALIKAQELKSENNALLEENNDLYTELTFANKQHKELTECAKQQDRVLDIIKEKNVDTYLIRVCISLEHYNSEIRRKNQNNTYSYEIWYELTQEEFDLLKRWVENEVDKK